MGLFHKKEACPVCGGEVKGLFHKKIGEGRNAGIYKGASGISPGECSEI